MLLLILDLLGLLGTGVAQAKAEERLEFGTRGGFSYSSGDQRFWQVEAYASWRLPWTWHMGSNWLVRSRLDLTAGVLDGCDEAGFVGTLGPNVFFDYKQFPLTLNLGVSPTVLSRDDFGCRDFGIPFQFTSHAGLEWALTSRFHLGYRIQHMSNAGLESPNPGLNMNMFSVSFGF
jgi:hypothetical protein